MINSRFFVGAGFHCGVVVPLLGLEFGLVDASLGVEPVLEHVALLVKLRIHIRRLEEVFLSVRLVGGASLLAHNHMALVEIVLLVLNGWASDFKRVELH